MRIFTSFALTLLCACSTTASVSAQPVGLGATEVDELDRTIEAELKRVLSPTSDPVPGWSDGGITVRSLLETPTPRGPMALFVPDADVPAVLFLAEDVDKVLPKGWHRERSQELGGADRASEGEAALMRVSPQLLLVAAGKSRKVGSAECSVPDAYTITYYRKDDAKPSQPDVQGDLVRYFLDRYLRRLASFELCTVMKQVAPERFRVRSFTPAGRPLAELDKSESDAELVPAADAARRLSLGR